MRYLVALVLLLNTSLLWADDYITYQSEEDFETVLSGLKMAIEERGLYINNMMHMNEMLERTGKDLGQSKPLYLHAESIEFCSAVLSRKMIGEDPRRIINCPFIIAVYVLPDEPEITYVAHRRLADEQATGAMAEVMAMLQGVSQAAVAGW